LNRPAEGSDVVYYCSDHSVFERWPLTMQKITSFLSPSMALAVGVFRIPSRINLCGLGPCFGCINVDIPFCCSFRSSLAFLQFLLCIFCYLPRKKFYIKCIYGGSWQKVVCLEIRITLCLSGPTPLMSFHPFTWGQKKTQFPKFVLENGQNP
jgi:hypothetical protein